MSKPINFPPSPFSQQEAIYCANLVDTAYDMYAQWKKLQNPDSVTSVIWATHTKGK